MYVLHDSDGRITGVITGDKHYGEQLTKHDHLWLFLAAEDDSRIFNFDATTNYVDVQKKAAGVPHPDCLSPCEQVSLTADKNSITANGVDVAKIYGIPAGAKLTIISDAGVEFDGIVDDGDIELSASDPTTYTVHVTAGAKYLPTSVQVVAE